MDEFTWIALSLAAAGFRDSDGYPKRPKIRSRRAGNLGPEPRMAVGEVNSIKLSVRSSARNSPTRECTMPRSDGDSDDYRDACRRLHTRCRGRPGVFQGRAWFFLRRCRGWMADFCRAAI